MAIEVFKIIDKQTPVYLHDLETIEKSSYSFRYNNTVNIPRVNTTRYGLHSLRYGAAKLWNELPNDLREGISLNNFKNLISKWDGDGCSCSFCSYSFLFRKVFRAMSQWYAFKRFWCAFKKNCFRFAIHIFLAWLYLCVCFSLYFSPYLFRVVLVFIVLITYLLLHFNYAWIFICLSMYVHVFCVYIYIYIYIYVWKLNQTVLELDFRAVTFLFFPRRDLNPHHWYTAAPFA